MIICPTLLHAIQVRDRIVKNDDRRALLTALDRVGIHAESLLLALHTAIHGMEILAGDKPDQNTIEAIEGLQSIHTMAVAQFSPLTKPYRGRIISAGP